MDIQPYLFFDGRCEEAIGFYRDALGGPLGDSIMRFMIIVKATEDSEAGVMPEEELFAAMATYHEELARAGALVDASGLHASAEGWRIQYDGDKRSFSAGPFADPRQLIAGYTIIRTDSREEAIEWSKRFPNPAADGKRGEIEVRQLFELEEFEPSEAIERFRRMDEEMKSS